MLCLLLKPTSYLGAVHLCIFVLLAGFDSFTITPTLDRLVLGLGGEILLGFWLAVVGEKQSNVGGWNT